MRNIARALLFLGLSTFPVFANTYAKYHITGDLSCDPVTCGLVTLGLDGYINIDINSGLVIGSDIFVGLFRPISGAPNKSSDATAAAWFNDEFEQELILVAGTPPLWADFPGSTSITGTAFAEDESGIRSGEVAFTPAPEGGSVILQLMGMAGLGLRARRSLRS